MTSLLSFMVNSALVNRAFYINDLAVFDNDTITWPLFNLAPTSRFSVLVQKYLKNILARNKLNKYIFLFGHLFNNIFVSLFGHLFNNNQVND